MGTDWINSTCGKLALTVRVLMKRSFENSLPNMKSFVMLSDCVCLCVYICVLAFESVCVFLHLFVGV